jgi:hypothetical protein
MNSGWLAIVLAEPASVTVVKECVASLSAEAAAARHRRRPTKPPSRGAFMMSGLR